ncbi:hypothetical protein ACH41E_09255 [Streptomyces sp. NPDC020412]|uniref:hypothetical protein n=1 Tax=Streptomyces sp. NPDC020412 TaxID=3365073 RepID=UPI00379C15D0
MLLGALMTHFTTYSMERSRHRRDLVMRWDAKKLEAYEGYIDAIRTCVFLAVTLYETREGIREREQPEADLLAEMTEAGRVRGRAFERIMLLAGDEVVEAAHDLNADAIAVDWQAHGKVTGTLDDWRDRNRAVFRAINRFHETARDDLGVSGSVAGEQHPERDLLLPPARDGFTIRREAAPGPDAD